MTRISEQIQKLKSVLNEPLPGIEAQKEMAPYLTDPKRFDQTSKSFAKPGAVMLLLYPDESHNLVIPFMKRTEYPGVHSGQISLPGGKYEEHDSSLVDTALRESQEELGINPGSVELIGKLTDLFVTVSNFNIVPYVFYSSQRPDFIPEELEVAEIIESRVNHLIDPATIKETTIKVSGKFSLRTPYYDLNGQILWGATAMIMSEFLTVYKRI